MNVIRMQDECDKVCVFEESLEIDFDYEFDAAKWFDLAGEYSPSPFIAKLEMGADELVADSAPASPRCGSDINAFSAHNDAGAPEVSSSSQGREGPQMLRSRSLPTSQSNVPERSRLLRPTASHLAKQGQNIGLHLRRVPERLPKPGNPIKSPGETDATKRQKLEFGYLRKVAQLKHSTSFSHKSSKKGESTDVNSSLAKPKVTVPKQPDLATSHRALRQRSNHAPQFGSDSSSLRTRPLNGKIQEAQISVREKNRIPTPLPGLQDKDTCGGKVVNGSGMLEQKRRNSSNALEQKKADQVYSFRANQLNRKISLGKGDIGVVRNCKREVTVPREFKLSNSKKLPQNPPAKLFSKLSLISENRSTLELEEDPQVKVLEKNESFPMMKENKHADAGTGKLSRCFEKGERMITYNGNHVTRVRSFSNSLRS